MAPLPSLAPSVTINLQCVTCNPGLLGAVAAALPALAYPFLPSGPQYSCGSALMWSSGLNLFCFHFVNTLAWAFGLPYTQEQFWVLPLTIMSYLVGLVRVLRRHSDSQIRRDDFEEAANIAFCIAIYQGCRVGHELLPIPERVDSLESVVTVLLAILWDAGILTTSTMVYAPFTESAQTVLYHLATRRVRWWIWLSEDDADDTFQPSWSVFLSVFVHIAGPVLLYYQAMGMEKFTTVTPRFGFHHANNITYSTRG